MFGEIELEVCDEIVIGRDEAAGFGSALANFDTVSRRHFRVTWDGENARIRDLGSTNGTYCDGTALDPDHELDLRDGMSIQMGRSGPVISARRTGA